MTNIDTQETYYSVYAYWCPNTISIPDDISNTTGAASGTGIVISSGTHEFIRLLVGCVLLNL